MLSVGIAFVVGAGVGGARNVQVRVLRLRDDGDDDGRRVGRTRDCDWPMDDQMEIENGCAKLLGVVGRGFAAVEE
jgi:hypothetical protein